MLSRAINPEGQHESARQTSKARELRSAAAISRCSARLSDTSTAEESGPARALEPTAAAGGVCLPASSPGKHAERPAGLVGLAGQSSRCCGSRGQGQAVKDRADLFPSTTAAGMQAPACMPMLGGCSRRNGSQPASVEGSPHDRQHGARVPLVECRCEGGDQHQPHHRHRHHGRDVQKAGRREHLRAEGG